VKDVPTRRLTMKLMRVTPFLLLALASADASFADVRSFPAGPWGSVEVNVPAGWTAKVETQKAKGGPSIQLAPGRGVPLVLLLTSLPGPGDADETTRSARRIVEVIRGSLQKIAVEDALPVRGLGGPDCRALYVSATDRTVVAPTLENFKYVDQGVAAVGRLIVTFTVFTNIKDCPERAQALDMVRTARHGLPGPPWRTPNGGVALSYPGRPWRLALDLPGYDVGPAQLTRGGVRLAAERRQAGMVVTVFLEESPPGKAAADHRDEAWKRMQQPGPTKREDVRRSMRGTVPTLEYRIPRHRGVALNQKHVNAYLVRDEIWVDVHLSKLGFQESDAELFDKILASVRFEQ
jgi:hypothetical protein